MSDRDPTIQTLIRELAESSRQPPNLPHLDPAISRPPRRRGWIVAVAAAAVVLVAVGAAALLPGFTREEATDVVTTGQIPVSTTARTVPEATTIPPPATTVPPVTSAPDDPVPPPTAAAPPFSIDATSSLDSGTVHDLVLSDQWLWAVTDAGVLRIDPITGSVDESASLDAMNRANVEVGEGAVWVAHGVHLSRVAPETVEVVASIELGPYEQEPGFMPTRPVSFGYGTLWVGTMDGVLMVDPVDLQVVDRLDTGYVTGIAVGANSVWVLVDDARLLRVDPTTLEILAETDLSGVFRPSIGTSPIAFGLDALWIGSNGLTRIDAATGDVRAIIAEPGCCGPTAIGFAAGHVIVSGSFDTSPAHLFAVDPTDGRLHPLAAGGSAVFSIAGDDHGFWFASSRSGTIGRYDATP